MIRKKEYLKPEAELLCQMPHQMLMGSPNRPGGIIDPFDFNDGQSDFIDQDDDSYWIVPSSSGLLYKKRGEDMY